jgi:hypothetical protein
MIDLGNISGDIDVYVPQDVGRRFWLSMQTPGGAWVYLTDSGQYTISATDSRVQVINNAGNATLIAADQQSTRSIPVGQKGILSASGGDITLVPGYNDLLQNSIFDTGDVGAWGCAPGPYDQPPQSHDGIEAIDGLSALRLVRDDTEAHGEIFCTQTFGPVGQVGLDVSGYSYLELKITFYVNYQSLDLCGTKGSECPLTVRLNYIDNSSADGELRNWIHGFYTRSDSQLNYPTRCDSCILDHELVNSKAWYTYDSGNLLSQISTNQEPRQLNNIQFYASGHRFDVYISSVLLLAGQASSEVSTDSVSSQPTEQGGSP